MGSRKSRRITPFLSFVSPLLKPPTTSLCSHALFGLHNLSASADQCQWVTFFSLWRNSVPPLCFISPSVSDAIYRVPLCCHLSWQQSITGYRWEGCSSTAIPPTSASRHCEPTEQNRGHYFQSNPCLFVFNPCPSAFILVWLLAQLSFC